MIFEKKHHDHSGFRETKDGRQSTDEGTNATGELYTCREAHEGMGYADAPCRDLERTVS